MPESAPSQIKKKERTGSVQQVHVLNADEVQRRSHLAQLRRRKLTLISFVLMVLLPLAAVASYYFAVAADRYSVEAKFAIRSPGASSPSDFLGMVASVSTATSTGTDSYIVVDFIESRDLVDRLEEKIDLRAIYDTPLADPLMRLDSTSTKEDLVDYMARMVSVYYDTSSQILTLEVQAFTPEGAQTVSAAILEICDELVNKISEKIRQDTMRSAETEVARVEAVLDDHRRALAAFRDAQQDIDPAASVGSQMQLLGALEAELASARARLQSLTGFLNDDAPSVRILRGQIEAMEEQLEVQRARLGSGDLPDTPGGAVDDAATSLSDRVGTYEDLAVDLEFLQQAYFTALASREAARIEAGRAQRYLAAFVQPSLPEKALYPNRALNTLIFGCFALMLWAMGLMMVYVIREHSS